jgi:Tol biopolymer transport system component
VNRAGVSPYAYQTHVSPDGRWIAYVDVSKASADGSSAIGVSRTDGREAHTVATLPAGEAVSGWGPDSASLLVWNRNEWTKGQRPSTNRRPKFWA